MAEACYIPQYKPASFKGTPFDATQAESEHGRRGAEAEFVFGEETAYADLGRKIRRFHLKARWVKNTHIDDSNSFIRVLESPGPGTLVHPTRGSVLAACKVAKFKDEILEGAGITTAELEFVEAKDWFGSAAQVPALLLLQTAPFLSAVGQSFLNGYSTAQLAFTSVPSIVRFAQSAVSMLGARLDSVSSYSSEKALNDVRDQVSIAVSDPYTLLDPEFTFSVLSSTIGAIDNYSISPSETVDVLRFVVNWAANSQLPRDDSRQLADIIVASLSMISAAYIARNSIQVPSSTMQVALKQYDMVTTALNNELVVSIVNCDNCLHLALSEFKTQAQTLLLSRAYNSPAIIQYQFGSGVSSIVAAHEIFGDARKFGLIEGHNSYAPPYLLPQVITAPRLN